MSKLRHNSIKKRFSSLASNILLYYGYVQIGLLCQTHVIIRLFMGSVAYVLSLFLLLNEKEKHI